MCSFYKINNALLKFKHDSIEVQFNHFLMRRENMQRTSEELEKGQFKLSYSVIEKEFDISRGKAQRLVKSFIEMGIIEPILITKVRGESSIYGYISAYENVDFIGRSADIQNDKQNDKQKSSNCNDLEQSNDIQNDKQSDKSKKELLKRNIYIDEIWSLYPKKQGKAAAMKKIPKIINDIGKDKIIECIRNYIDYVEATRRNSFDLQYMNGSTFFNGRYLDFMEKQKEPTAIGPKTNKINKSIRNNDNNYSRNMPKIIEHNNF